MRNIVYTTHARQRMALRGITAAMVQQAIDAPDERGTGYQARLLAYRRFPYWADQGRLCRKIAGDRGDYRDVGGLK